MVTALEVIALEESGFSIGFSITLKDCTEEKKIFFSTSFGPKSSRVAFFLFLQTCKLTLKSDQSSCFGMIIWDFKRKS